MNWSITKTFIDIKPGTAPVRINASMYDNNSRLVVMTVKDGGRAFDMTGLSARVEGTRADGTGFMSACTIGDGTVSFLITKEMTNSAGDQKAEIILFAPDNHRIGTANFIIRVEPAALNEDTEISPEDETLINQYITSLTEKIDEAMELVETAEQAAESAEASSGSAAISADSAQHNALKAEQYASSAKASADRAESAAGNVSSQAQRAESAAAQAAVSASNAAASAAEAGTSANRARNSMVQAAGYQAQADRSASDAQTYAAGANASRLAAESSRRQAAQSASSASSYANAAQSSAEGALADAARANTFSQNAAASATAAEASAEAAAASAEEAESSLSSLEDEVASLRDDFNDIIETVYSSNIFNQAIATITEGKYLNPNNGNVSTNASYCYVNDYIPIKPETTYYGTTWDRNTLGFTGEFIGIAVFYTSNKEYISGLSGSSSRNPFVTPENCAYMRISMGTSGYNSHYYMFEEGSTRSTQYIPYSETKKLKIPISVVDINGNGDFTSIKDAVNTLPGGSSILVMPGTYEENVKAWSKEIHIIGFDREACILKDDSGNYSTPPLEIGAGSVQNMSIIEQAEGAGTETMGAYAIHIESNILFNNKLLIRNCYIYSDSTSAIGMGLRGGCSVRIEDCELICAGGRASTGAAPLYFHDADGQPYWGTANLYLHNNVLRNTASTLFSMLTINSIHKENTTYMHVMYNIFVRSKTPSLTQKYNTWNSSGNTDADGWNGLSHMYLEDDSFGNNQSELNYSA